MSDGSPRHDVAAFDVDGTLTVRDCVRPFLVAVGGWTGLAAALLRQPWRSAAAAVRADRDEMKEVVVGGVLRGRTVAEIEAAGARHAQTVERHWLRDDVLGRLRWHQAAGHRTVLVSASLGPYLRPLGRSLGVDAVLCTEVTRQGDRYGGTLDGGNCRAAEKARRLEAWLAGAGLAGATLWAYGDSAGDEQMLALADRPRRVDGVRLPHAPTEGAG